MDEDTERRILAAREQAQRERETAEFLADLKTGDEILRPIRNPEAFIMRDKYKGAANRGELRKNNCQHPFHALDQYIDTDPSVKRRGLPLNLYVCNICDIHLWMVDPWGNPKSDL